MRLNVPSLVCVLAATMLPGVAAAGPIHDFATAFAPAGLNTALGPGPITVGPVTAHGFKKNGTWTAADLVARNSPNDHGLGVCSEGLANCAIGRTGGGDNNELSATGVFEAIRFSLADGYAWTGLWVSSLDSGDADGSEEGRLYWGASSSIDDLLAGPSFGFKWGDFGAAVEGDLLTLGAAAGFNTHARYVLFVPDGPLADNNDYLVWGASAQPVPEPGTLALLGGGLAAAWRARRRKRS